MAVLVGGLIGTLLSLLSADFERHALFDTWQRAAPREISTDNVAVVLIDSLSLEAVGSWPWSRYYIARLVESIAIQQPDAIAFDMVFAEPDALNPLAFTSLYPELDPQTRQTVNRLPTMDQVLGQVIGSSPILLARLGVPRDGIDPALLLVDPHVAGTPPADTLRTDQVLTSIPELDDVALAHAMVNGPSDHDGIVRRVPLSVIVGDRPMPGLAVEAARLSLGAEQLEWRGSRLLIGEMELPADETGSLPLRLGRIPEAAVYSAAELLAGKVTSDAFAGKVVIVGLGAEGTADIVATALDKNIFGVLLQAQAVDAILEEGWVSRPDWALGAEIAASLALLVLILIAGGTQRYWLLVPAFIFTLALPLLSFIAFDRTNLLLDPARPLLVGIFAAAAMWITLYLLARAERVRLASELVEQRVASAEQEGELKAARRIQLGMVPGPESLRSLDARVGIGAVLQPARSVGGDFYDAVMIGPDRLLFIVGDVTGKGVPAALFMALSKALSKSALRRSEGDLGDAMSALNRELMAEADEEMGVTMLVGVLDCATGSVAVVNAGHENPLVVRANGNIETLPMTGGPPFCVLDFPYTTEQHRLAPADSLIVLTDGATEAQNAAKDLFGVKGLLTALEGEGDIPADKRASELAASIRAFEGETEPSDDLTIMVLRYRGLTD